MPWAKIDDQLFTHPKIRRAWRASRASLGLYVLALSYSNRHLRDGRIDEDFIADQIPDEQERDEALNALVNAGLWERNGDCWLIHDYLEYNMSASELQRKRDWNVARKGLERDRDLVASIKLRDQNRCRYCGKEVNWRDRKGPGGGTYDHIVPRGPNTLENIVVACRACNMRKGQRTPDEAEMSLRAI